MIGSAFWVGPPDATVAVGANGWLFWNLADLDVRIRVEDVDGAFRPATVAVTRFDGRPVTGEELRAVPLRRLSDALTVKEVSKAVRDAWSQRGAPDLSPATPRDVALERVHDFPVREPTDKASTPTTTSVATSRAKKDDAFYAGMADRYRTLSATSRRPAVELAEEEGVKVSTVHRWLREAKYREALRGADLQRIARELRG
jgi:hypothetical protein